MFAHGELLAHPVQHDRAVLLRSARRGAAGERPLHRDVLHRGISGALFSVFYAVRRRSSAPRARCSAWSSRTRASGRATRCSSGACCHRDALARGGDGDHVVLRPGRIRAGHRAPRAPRRICGRRSLPLRHRAPPEGRDLGVSGGAAHVVAARRRHAPLGDVPRNELHEINRQEVDRLLDKISVKGIASLTPAEGRRWTGSVNSRARRWGSCEKDRGAWRGSRGPTRAPAGSRELKALRLEPAPIMKGCPLAGSGRAHFSMLSAHRL